MGVFLRRRARAEGEFRRRNIFELYIEEVVEACNRLKGGTLPKDKLKAQLQKIAMSRTGGEKTDEALGKTGGGPEGLPDSIIVTEEGIEGAVEVARQAEAAHETTAPESAGQKDHHIKRPQPAARPVFPKEHGSVAKGRKGKTQLGLFGEEAPARRKSGSASAKADTHPKPRVRK
jgi:DNA topoisomerase-6 subunit B